MYQLLTVFLVSFAMLKTIAQPGKDQTSYKGRKCKDFVHRVFKHYGLPAIPANRSFPHSSNRKVDLTKFNQGKPEFIIETTSLKIDKGLGVPDSGHLPVALKMSERKYNGLPHTKSIRFEGRILKDGRYELLITEINPSSLSASSLSNRLEEDQPITHRFRFSNQCSFLKYEVHQPRSPLEFEGDYGDGYKRGFDLSSDEKCVFDEAKNMDEHQSYIHVMSKKELQLGQRSWEWEEDRMIRMMRREMKKEKNIIKATLHPYYYWKVCHLAKPIVKESHDDSGHDGDETVDQ